MREMRSRQKAVVNQLCNSMSCKLRHQSPVGVIQIGLGDAPGQGGYARMHGRREGAGVDVVLYQQHLRLCFFISYGPQGAYVMTSGVHAVGLPAVNDYHHPLIHQCGCL